jgi:hypothetical protein
MRAKLGFLAMAVVAACFIDRKTTDFECSTTDECEGDLVCRGNYCVVDDGSDDSSTDFDDEPSDDPADDLPTDDSPDLCPPECSECDPNDRVCVFVCGTNDRCGDIDCPDGWECQILCQGAMACGDITCEDGPCNVQCADNNSCGIVDCRGACACDVTCFNGACEDALCPIVAGRNCTMDGTTETGCTSSAPDCNRCD